jgi:hypothetical protein
MTDTPINKGDTDSVVVEIKQEHINSLAVKLDALDLKPEEKALLSVCIGMAARIVKIDKLQEPPPFVDQFATAFTAESANYIVSRMPSHIG